MGVFTPESKGTLIVKPQTAQLEHAHKGLLKFDPYAVFKVGVQTQTSSVCKDGGKHPSWTDTLKFDINGDQEATVELYDKGTLAKDKMIGRAVIPFHQILALKNATQWYDLMLEGKEVGKIMVHFEYLPMAEGANGGASELSGDQQQQMVKQNSVQMANSGLGTSQTAGVQLPPVQVVSQIIDQLVPNSAQTQGVPPYQIQSQGQQPISVLQNPQAGIKVTTTTIKKEEVKAQNSQQYNGIAPQDFSTASTSMLPDPRDTPVVKPDAKPIYTPVAASIIPVSTGSAQNNATAAAGYSGISQAPQYCVSPSDFKLPEGPGILKVTVTETKETKTTTTSN